MRAKGLGFPRFKKKLGMRSFVFPQFKTNPCKQEGIKLNQSVLDLAEQFLQRSNLHVKADVDAIHIAVATVHGMDYLLTWNCKHIANAQIQRKLAEISLDFGYELPILCTPYELLGV
jgi:hypothetical protein